MTEQADDQSKGSKPLKIPPALPAVVGFEQAGERHRQDMEIFSHQLAPSGEIPIAEVPIEEPKKEEKKEKKKEKEKKVRKKPSIAVTPPPSPPKASDGTAAPPDDNWMPSAGLPPTSTVEITISARNLTNTDTFSKSDPMCIVSQKPPYQKEWSELMRTETIEDDLDPDFMEKLTMEYHFEERQQLKFEIYDIDSPQDPLEKADFLGFAECTLAQVVSAGASGLTLPLSREKIKYIEGETPKIVSGNLILVATELAALKDEVTIRFSGQNVGKMFCCFVAPKVCYSISRLNSAGNYLVTYRSDLVPGPNPDWVSVTVLVRRLCNGDKDVNLKIECWQVHPGGAGQKIVGSCITTLNKLIRMGTGGIPLSGGGTLIVHQAKVTKVHTFVDYIQGGTQIHCCISLDFTSSNGDPRDRQSLHYFSPIAANQPNPYEQAIRTVGLIIQDYDTDKLFPVYGFGARIPPNRQVSHNFFITLTDQGYCQGIEGILEQYRRCLRRIELYGPTNFCPVIKHVSDMAAENQNGEHYFVLLIITDGVITDMQQTKEAIVNASNLPVSLIIIGVGDEDFDEMEVLDGDSVRISFKGNKASRDIVQFVPYRDALTWLHDSMGREAVERFLNQRSSIVRDNIGTEEAAKVAATSIYNKTNQLAQAKLAQEVLAEIPEQLTSYMKTKGILPGGEKTGGGSPSKEKKENPVTEQPVPKPTEPGP